MRKIYLIISALAMTSLFSCSLKTSDNVMSFNEDVTSEAETTSRQKDDTVITLTSLGDVSNQIETRIEAFNDMDNGYIVEVKDYGKFLNLPPDDYSGDDLDERFEIAYRDFDKDAFEDFSENVGADIFSYSTDCVVFDKLRNNGCLVNLYELENDEHIDISGLNKAVVNLCETDSKLFEIPVIYTLSTLIGAEKYISKTDTWTIRDLIESYNSVSDSVLLTDTNIRHEAYRYFVSCNMKEYFESSKEGVLFSSDDLRDTLNFCIQFSDQNRIVTPETEKVPYFMKGLYSISGFSEFHNEAEEYEECNDDFDIIGFPSSKGYYSNIDIAESYGINAKSTDNVKKGALEFLKFMVSEDAQIEFTYGFPVNNIAFYNMASEKIQDKQLTQNEYDKLLNCINTTKCRKTSDVINFTKKYSIYMSDAVIGYTSVDESIENIRNAINHSE